MKIRITFLLCFFLNITAFSQSTKYYPAEEFESALILKKIGGVVVYNGPKHSFTFNINGDSIRPDSKPYLITTNKRILKPSTMQFQRKFNFDSLDEAFLRENMVGVMNHLKIQQHNSKDLSKNYEFIVINGQTFMFWECEMPAGNKSIDKQYYMETICFDQVLILNIPVMKGDKRSSSADNNIRDFLTAIAKSLKLNDYPIDIEKLSKELKGK
jgi:hypothetical protein